MRAERKYLKNHSKWYRWKDLPIIRIVIKQPSQVSLEAPVFLWPHIGYQVDMKTWTVSILAMTQNGAYGSQETWSLISVLQLSSSLKFLTAFCCKLFHLSQAVGWDYCELSLAGRTPVVLNLGCSLVAPKALVTPQTNSIRPSVGGAIGSSPGDYNMRPPAEEHWLQDKSKKSVRKTSPGWK